MGWQAQRRQEQRDAHQRGIFPGVFARVSCASEGDSDERDHSAG